MLIDQEDHQTQLFGLQGKTEPISRGVKSELVIALAEHIIVSDFHL